MYVNGRRFSSRAVHGWLDKLHEIYTFIRYAVHSGLMCSTLTIFRQESRTQDKIYTTSTYVGIHNEFTPPGQRKKKEEKEEKEKIREREEKGRGDSIRHSIHPQKPRGKEKEVVS